MSSCVQLNVCKVVQHVRVQSKRRDLVPTDLQCTNRGEIPITFVGHFYDSLLAAERALFPACDAFLIQGILETVADSVRIRFQKVNASLGSLWLMTKATRTAEICLLQVERHVDADFLAEHNSTHQRTF